MIKASRRLKVNLMQYRLAVVATFDEKSHSVCLCVSPSLVSSLVDCLITEREAVDVSGTARRRLISLDCPLSWKRFVNSYQLWRPSADS